jgi:hypothetical protein
MPPMELAERLALRRCCSDLPFFSASPSKEIYKRDEPTIPAASGPFRWSDLRERCFI